MGSVKDLSIIEKPGEKTPGKGRFVFSDRYSVFDWGEMPDHLDKKGEALCMIGAYFFELLSGKGIKNHYIDLVENNVMEVHLLNVIKPGFSDNRYDYTAYKDARYNFLIPLEVIYRNTLPKGSSVFRRLESGSLKLEDIGLTSMPEPGQVLDRPVVEFSTKLETTDRYITKDEAREISGLSQDELDRIMEMTLEVSSIITEEVGKAGLVNEDGKFEFGMDQDRNIILVDVLGTPDECRFTYNGMTVSNELTREFYRSSEWYNETEKAKKENRQIWKELVTQQPPSLPADLKELISQMYQACCNEITGKKSFNVPPLKEVLVKINAM
ncbi:MAG: phosphoribosylaminoimidazolesuccinocarboxamide synthase [Bacteroidota bacterium]